MTELLCLLAGWGKSLCYQMPALLLGGTTLVVSPLLALMRDQLQRLPPQLPAGMLWGGQSKQEALQVLGDLRVSLNGVQCGDRAACCVSGVACLCSAGQLYHRLADASTSRYLML